MKLSGEKIEGYEVIKGALRFEPLLKYLDK